MRYVLSSLRWGGRGVRWFVPSVCLVAYAVDAVLAVLCWPLPLPLGVFRGLLRFPLCALWFVLGALWSVLCVLESMVGGLR